MAERTIKAGEFKAKCLRLLDEVAETGDTLVITKRGRVVARLVPAVAAKSHLSPIGFLKSHLIAGPETKDYSVWTSEMQRAQEIELDALIDAKPSRKRTSA